MKKGFTLIELLIVVGLLGIIAGLTVPALKNIGKGIQSDNTSITLVSDLQRARQLAVANHQTVYVVFAPTNTIPLTNNFLNLTTNISPLNSYCLCSLGKLGDQPGQHQWHTITDWKSFGNGYMIHPNKFAGVSTINTQWSYDYPRLDNGGGKIQPFNYVTIPFPQPTSTTTIQLPFIAFDYQGRLISQYDGMTYPHSVIPIVKGDVQNGTVTVSADSMGIDYSIVDVDPLTGFVTLETHHIK